MSAIGSFFGPDGPIARAHRRYEERPGQVALAEAIDRALAHRAHLDAEAPAGTGKSFAYLVPLIQHALARERPAVVVTANIALQEQLVRKDLPFLAKVMPEKFSYALVKGLGNYLCLDRAGEAMQTLWMGGNGQGGALREWVQTTKTGDRSDLSAEPPREAWRRICGVTDLCNGSECRYYDDCFAMAARARARKVQLIVTNYHLLFAHLLYNDVGKKRVHIGDACAYV